MNINHAAAQIINAIKQLNTLVQITIALFCVVEGGLIVLVTVGGKVNGSRLGADDGNKDGGSMLGADDGDKDGEIISMSLTFKSEMDLNELLSIRRDSM